MTNGINWYEKFTRLCLLSFVLICLQFRWTLCCICRCPMRCSSVCTVTLCCICMCPMRCSSVCTATLSTLCVVFVGVLCGVPLSVQLLCVVFVGVLCGVPLSVQLLCVVFVGVLRGVPLSVQLLRDRWTRSSSRHHYWNSHLGLGRSTVFRRTATGLCSIIDSGDTVHRISAQTVVRVKVLAQVYVRIVCVMR